MHPQLDRFLHDKIHLIAFWQRHAQGQLLPRLGYSGMAALHPAGHRLFFHRRNRTVIIRARAVAQRYRFPRPQPQHAPGMVRIFAAQGQQPILRLTGHKESRHNNSITFPILTKKLKFCK